MKLPLVFIVIQVLYFIVTTVNSHLIPRDDKLVNNEFNRINNFEPGRRIHRTRRSLAVRRRQFLWNDGIIPYEIEDIFSGDQRRLFKRAMRHWEQSTCIHFVKRIEKVHKNYIVFTKSDCGCCSFVGKKRYGPQPISIVNQCSNFGIILHELGHAIGFHHEHTRYDRDQYIKVFLDNVQEDKFNKLSVESTNTLGLPYDYNSIMHYARFAFAKKFRSTIEPTRKINGRTPEIGQRRALSTVDITATKLLYNCSGSGSFFEPYYMIIPPIHPDDSPEVSDKCKWTIRAAEGERIKITLTSWDIQETPNCTVEYVEIKNGYLANSPVLARICGTVNKSIIVTASNFVSVTYARIRYENYHLGFILKYETICGGDINLESDDIYYLEAPNYPGLYEPNKQCYWFIKVPHKHHIEIKFHYFELEESKDCKNDFVKVQEGRNENAPVIGSYCGKNDHLEVASLMRRIFLTFISNESIEAGGFSATISAKPINNTN
ncbi:dorsal-ventral patterning protein tolloid-like [Microplitis demolitor]|uniref:dorsal-ventral patterning protein tolloid-like n=1 Tax=Microplitis demolitor TaxID=69319 RepID=UPI0006D4FEE6|nr:dorsal-ventral patterning protein tolloid-like [Microplitis demolitor]